MSDPQLRLTVHPETYAVSLSTGEASLPIGRLTEAAVRLTDGDVPLLEGKLELQLPLHVGEAICSSDADPQALPVLARLTTDALEAAILKAHEELAELASIRSHLQRAEEEGRALASRNAELQLALTKATKTEG